MIDLSHITLNTMVEEGIHFGHKVGRWNPKMAPYIYGSRNGVHIIDLRLTLPLLKKAMTVLYNTVLNRGRVLFVGTKVQASDIVAEAAKRCGQYYVNHRWLGGMLTNWNTVSSSIKKLIELENMLKDPDLNFTKKEKLKLSKDIEKLELYLGGIREMGGIPHLIVVVDTNKEHIAIKEAMKLKIPVMAILDTNSDPTGISYPIPGNDDAIRSIKFYMDLMSDVVLAAIESDLIKSGVKIDEIKDAEDSGNESDIKSPKDKLAAISEKRSYRSNKIDVGNDMIDNKRIKVTDVKDDASNA